MTQDGIISILAVISILSGFYYMTKWRLSRIEKDLQIYQKDNTDILDRLARIETKLDFYTTNNK
jgi:recombinational DNA repair protein RecT